MKVKVCSMSELLPSDTQPQTQDDGTSEDKRHPDSTVSEQSLAASSSLESPSSTAEVGGQASRPGVAQVPGSTSKRRVDLTRKSGRFFRVYLRSIVLLVTAAIAGIAAFVLFPKDGPVAPSGGPQSVEIDASFIPYTVIITLNDDPSHDGTRVAVQVTTTTPQSARATLSIGVPPTTWGGTNKCSPQPSRCYYANGNEKLALFEFPGSKKYLVAGRPFYREVVEASIPGVGYNAAWNSEYVSATLPSVPVYLLKAGNVIREDVSTTIAIGIPDPEKYTWTSGTAPTATGSYVGWYFTSSPGAAEVNNAISLSAQDSATKLIFVAGALLGIAGGALVGAIQEAVKSK
jgi:hypothetical protein